MSHRRGVFRVKDGAVKFDGPGPTERNAAPDEPVPDHVFEPDFRLMPVEELGRFVEREKHLPNVPSAAEIKANGLNLGEFQMKLLEKIEELTLYALQQARTNSEQQATIESQQITIRDHRGALERKDAEIGSLNTRLAALEQMMERLARLEQK